MCAFLSWFSALSKVLILKNAFQTDQLADGRTEPHIRQVHMTFFASPIKCYSSTSVTKKNILSPKTRFLGHPIIFDIVVNLECLKIFVFEQRSIILFNICNYWKTISHKNVFWKKKPCFHFDYFELHVQRDEIEMTHGQQKTIFCPGAKILLRKIEEIVEQNF